MLIDFGQGEKEITVSLYTLVVYENEFHSDMIQDVFGRMAIRNDSMAPDEVAVLDFRDTNWTALTKVLWASLKTADDDVHPYIEWVQEIGEVNFYEIAGSLVPELQRKLFRSRVTALEE